MLVRAQNQLAPALAMARSAGTRQLRAHVPGVGDLRIGDRVNGSRRVAGNRRRRGLEAWGPPEGDSRSGVQFVRRRRRVARGKHLLDDRQRKRLVRVEDDGEGMGAEDARLSIERHATSKIRTANDLAAINTLGFRGEALASISSVSRLTLTSRTADQSEAWQAYAEGREQAVTVKPAAHPVGSTLEVLDLFYNTPARRKFMRTEKTEFGHIDEVVRRIALARFDVAINLSHNGKLIRQYRAAKEESQHERRLGSICGPAFLQHALNIDWQHGDLSIRGWVADPDGARQLGEMQYCYVNSRMMRDRLINHAIRQAYQDQLKDDQQPAYVLYLEVDPHQVDVNVHPAKHEVRFHQARLVHDFIYQAVTTVLQQAGQTPSLPLAETLEQGEQLLELAERRGKTLMVGFNRRFAPLYRQLKQQMNQPASIRMDKHRADSVGPQDLRFTLLDDYLHVVDTALWLAGGGEQLLSSSVRANTAGEMLYAEHHFACGDTLVTTSMHRRGGSQRESVQAVTDGARYQLTDMRHWLREDAQGELEQPVPGWQSTLVQRGFDGAVRHFLCAVANQSAPETGGEQALVAQRVVERLLRDNSM